MERDPECGRNAVCCPRPYLLPTPEKSLDLGEEREQAPFSLPLLEAGTTGPGEAGCVTQPGPVPGLLLLPVVARALLYCSTCGSVFETQT